ncbi:hypothetical protein MIN45_P0485 [Methylomarinovum tepidoasis]|uniref:Caspase family p20 domain-containing protein n=1 Tax=Methylomarinovum tepidoasis TaxID=2840183 RepID=A0AAU9CCZ4_9GAMM|nr:caspase family protein [Methylomarinovum sp. IN45]BCX88118.1 hypothetical protein MIN45_P0485 [Methylomarinovum sp. IN45]
MKASRWLAQLWLSGAAFLTGMLAGCASTPMDEVAVGPGQVDKLYVVDCLLPAQVRQLGQHMTYLAARKAVRTTAIDCEIRGGEYVAHDRSNYATALKIWLPQARAGDAKAQTYVGEIYEKGLGLTPDYQAAAHWYRKAAEQGYAPAMINLGFLYEKGLGVPRDPVAALNWYRRASGLDKTDIAFAASVEVYERKMAALRQDADKYRREAAGLREKLAMLQSEHRQTLKTLRRYQAQVRAGRREIQRLRRQLQRLPAGSGSALKQKLEEQIRRLQEKEQMVGLLEKELQRQNQQLHTLQTSTSQTIQAKESRIQQLEQELAQRNRTVEDLRHQLDQSRQRLQRLQQRVTQGNRQLADQIARLEALKRQVAEKKASGQTDSVDWRRLQAQLAAKQAEVARSRQALSDVQAEMARLQRLNQSLASKLADRQRQLARLAQRLSGVQQKVQSQAEQLQTLNRTLAEKEQAIQDLQQQLQVANRQLLSQRQGIEALKRQLARKKGDGHTGEAELALLSSQLQAKQMELARQQAQIRQLQAQLADLKRQAREQPVPLVARAETKAAGGPRIEIIDPPLRPQRGSLMVVTRGLVEARTVVGRVQTETGLLAFLVNDQDFPVDPSGTFKVKIPLKGEKTPVRLVAIDRASRRSELEFIILRDTQTAAPVPLKAGSEVEEELSRRVVDSLPREIFGRYYALIIGNNAYRHLPVLDTPINDAKALARVLRTRYGFQTKVLLDATRYDILKALNEYRKILTEKDNLLIYYAGHGTLEKVTQRGFWLPVDAEMENTANWISNQDVTDLLRIMNAAHVMVIADSCYSGSLTRSSVARLEAGMSPEKKAEWIKLMLKAKSRMALTSGGLSPVLDSGGGNHSVFAKALIQALERNDGVLESFRLYAQVSALVADAAREQDFHQVPEFAPIRHAGHEAGEFFFVPVPGTVQAGL